MAITETIKSIGDVSVSKEDDLIDVRGDSDTLQKVVDKLDDLGYHDDSGMATLFFGISNNEEGKITRILVTDFGEDDGYMCIRNEDITEKEMKPSLQVTTQFAMLGVI